MADVFLSDDTGQRLGWRLLLRCLSSGSATWIFRYTHAGRRNQINIGNLKTLDIEPARRATAKYADIYKVTPDVLSKLRADEQIKQVLLHAEMATATSIEESRQQ